MCGKMVDIPLAAEDSTSEESVDDSTNTEATAESGEAVPDFSHKITEYVDPPGEETAVASAENKSSVLKRMFEALLDPRSIQWMLLLGGALAILGLLVWLISMKIFENKIVVAAFLGTGTLLVLATGWWLKLKTKYQVAGQAVTFLGCVVMPLNLWFYHSQGLILITDHLWLGGVVCCLFYFATVRILRDPMFLYAAQAGITMTVLLLLADQGNLTNSTHFSLYLVVLGMISLHAGRIFPEDSSEFPREKYGMPLFWSGQIQMLVAIGFLFACQSITWGVELLNGFPLFQRGLFRLPDQFPINIANHYVLACGLWLAGVYASLYSSLFVKRTRWATGCAGFCLVMAEVTLFKALNIQQEGMIAFLAGTALLLHVVNHFLLKQNRQFDGAITTMASGLSAIAVLWALMLHFGAIKADYGNLQNHYEFTWGFVAATLFSAVCSRAIQVFTWKSQPRVSAQYFFLSAAALMIAASASLHLFAWDQWSQRAPVLILIPVCYLIASRFWRGKFPEVPLYGVAHVGTAVVLLHVFWASLAQGQSLLYVPQGSRVSLFVGLLFLEAMAFYSLAGWLRKRSINIYFAAASLCGAIWQFSGYLSIAPQWYVVVYSILGVISLIAARFIGLKEEVRYSEHREARKVVRGPGLPFYQSGNAVLLVAMFTAFNHAANEIHISYSVQSGQFAGWLELLSLFLTILAGAAGIVLSLNGLWKRIYIIGSVCLSAQIFILLNVLVDLSRWQKLEIFCVTIGIGILVLSHIGLFKEQEDEKEKKAEQEAVGFGLFIGSLMATIPLLFATFHFHLYTDGVFTLDDFFLIAIGVLMLVTGFSWKVKSTTLISGACLAIYFAMIIMIIAYNPQVAIGVYLGIGGLLLFGVGVLLSMYRERLLQIPDRISNREGIFKIIDWR